MNTNKVINELAKLFDIFNTEYFDDKLEEPMLMIQTFKKKNQLGWCTTKRVWNSKENWTEEGDFYEITITAESLNRSVEQIICTLLHEMVHLCNLQNNIKDYSGVYHNKKFKKLAEECDLIVEHDDLLGWSLTSPSEILLKFISKLDVDKSVFDFYRSTVFTEKIKKEREKKIVFKYYCPVCNEEIKSKKENLNVVCGECNSEFEPVDEN